MHHTPRIIPMAQTELKCIVVQLGVDLDGRRIEMRKINSAKRQIELGADRIKILWSDAISRIKAACAVRVFVFSSLLGRTQQQTHWGRILRWLFILIAIAPFN
jgi:hypothetical protein